MLALELPPFCMEDKPLRSAMSTISLKLHLMAFCYIKIVDYSEKVRSYAKSTYVSENTTDTVLCTVAGVVQAFFF